MGCMFSVLLGSRQKWYTTAVLDSILVSAALYNLLLILCLAHHVGFGSLWRGDTGNLMPAAIHSMYIRCYES